eukprot:4280913-Ditylum_brightwellii.AAC.1
MTYRLPNRVCRIISGFVWYASGLDPVWDLGGTRVKGRNGQANTNSAYGNQYITLPAWGR